MLSLKHYFTLYQLHFLYLLVLIILPTTTIISGVRSSTLSGREPSCPSSCFCDEDGLYVSCVGDSLGEFETAIPTHALRLEIRNYKIATLYPQTAHLDRMSQLEELKLQQTKIDSIANDTFRVL